MINTKGDLFISEVLERVGATNSIVPMQRAAFKQGYSFSTVPYAEQLKIWDHIWKNSGNRLAMLQAFFFLESTIGKHAAEYDTWLVVKDWQENVNSWALCDCLAKIYTKILEHHIEVVYAQLVGWNNSTNPWMRRQSVVSLLYFHSTKKVFLPFAEIVRLIHPLLADKEYYVQKGVGWAIKELYCIYPIETYQFVANNLTLLNPIAFTIALEKMGKGEKAVLKAGRKRTS